MTVTTTRSIACDDCGVVRTHELTLDQAAAIDALGDKLCTACFVARRVKKEQDDDDFDFFYSEEERDHFDEVEPEEQECPCCGSISHTKSIDGYCGVCRSHEKVVTV